MTNAVMTTGNAGKSTSRKPSGIVASLLSRLPFATLFYGAITVFALMVLNLPGAKDYVGADNDDTMRLVEVRDLLAGQGWFDMMQYRLGLGDGTLMHWSRLVDLPLANLISFFEMFLPRERAEAVTLTLWPMMLAVALLAAMGLAGRRIGGVAVMHVTLGLTALFLITGNRFLPGSIDHHNIQLVLVAIITAMLVDGERRPGSLAIAGVAAGLAIAVGAETALHIAIASVVVAGLWAWHGADFAAAARAYCLALVATVSAAFFLTVPPHLYSMVTCDNLSLGFYALTSIGAAALLLSTVVARRSSFRTRVVVLGIDGLVVAAAVLLIAPQCVSSPLGKLDPMMVTLWLDNVSEARSILAIADRDAGAFGGFYATGLIAAAICLFRMRLGARVEIHAILLAMISVSWAVAAIQVRGSVFSNLLAILPFALLIIDLRRLANADPENMGTSLAFAGIAMMSLPSVWALGGLVGTEGIKGIVERTGTHVASNGPACTSRTGLAPLANLAPTMVAAPLDLGVHILRFTPHHVLTAPYHRDQGGILTEMYIGMSKPGQAEAFLRGAGVTILAYCLSEWQTQNFVRLAPQGLYAELAEGKVPAYLEALPDTPTSGLKLYRLRPDAN